MANVVKHALHFQEQRRTLFLNLHEKDDYGRHRGQVLYGMRLVPSGTKVVIRPGAIKTAYGTKFFWDVINATDPDTNTLDLNDVSTVALGGQSVFDAANVSNRPIMVGIIARVSPMDPSRQPVIEDDASLSSDTIEFRADVIAYNKTTGQPTHDLTPLDPVNMDSLQPGYTTPGDYYKTWDLFGGAATVALKAGALATESLQVNDVLLGYVVIGGDSSGVPVNTLEGTPSGTWADGVAYVPIDNSWSALIDFLGYDPLLGRVTDRVTGDPVSGSALSQVPTEFEIDSGSHNGPLSLAPKFGTSPVFSASDPWAGTWDTYRLPNFLKDGEQLIWQLRRLDYFLRLWIDRTGDQELISLIQDGAGASLDFQAPLDQMLTQFTGTSGTNQNVLTWGDGAPNSPDTADDHPLKSGKVAHSGASGPGTDLADSHRQAIVALGESVRHILQDLFGFDGVDSGRDSIERVALRQVGKWNRTLYDALKHYDDGPIGRLPSAGVAEDDRPTLVQGTSTAYLDRESMYDALGQVANRSSIIGTNLLRNPKFISGEDVSTGNNEFPEWVRDGASTWDRVNVMTTLQVKAADVIMDSGNRGFYQELDDPIGSLMEDDSRMTASVCMEVVSGNVRISVEGWTDNGMGTKVFDVQSATLPAVAGYRVHSFSFKVDSPATVGYLRFTVESADGADCRVRIAGTWLGVGTAPENPAFDSNWHNFLPRDGGADNPMRGDIFLDDHDIWLGDERTDVQWNDKYNEAATDPSITYTGICGDPYVADDASLLTVLRETLVRSGKNYGANMLRNGNALMRSTESGTSLTDADAPPNWAFGGDTTGMTWNHGSTDEDRWHFQILDAPTTMTFENVMDSFPTNEVGTALDRHKLMSAALTIAKNTQALVWDVIFRDSGNSEIGRTQVTIPADASGRNTYTVSTLLSVTAAIDNIVFRLTNSSGVDADFEVHSAWLCRGQPPNDPHVGAGEWAPRGNPTIAMVNNLNMGSQRVTSMADSVNPQDAVTRSELDAIAGSVTSIFRTNRVVQAPTVNRTNNSATGLSVTKTFPLVENGAGGFITPQIGFQLNNVDTGGGTGTVVVGNRFRIGGAFATYSVTPPNVGDYLSHFLLGGSHQGAGNDPAYFLVQILDVWLDSGAIGSPTAEIKLKFGESIWQPQGDTPFITWFQADGFSGATTNGNQTLGLDCDGVEREIVRAGTTKGTGRFFVTAAWSGNTLNVTFRALAIGSGHSDNYGHAGMALNAVTLRGT